MPEPSLAPDQREFPDGSLTFETPEKAQAFSERVRERLEGERGESPRQEDIEQRVREAIREELAAETAGFVPPPIEQRKGEWQYTAEDHAAVQRYVNVAFGKDVQHAVKLLMKERGGTDEATVLRTIDLFHDTLTDHLYDEMSKRRMLPS